jgi:hypothetical protein
MASTSDFDFLRMAADPEGQRLPVDAFTNLRAAKNNLVLSFTLLYHQHQLLLSNHCILLTLGFSGYVTMGVILWGALLAKMHLQSFYLLAEEAKQE